MIEVKYGLLDKVVFFNGATMKFEEGVVKDVRIIPTGISKDEKGEDVLDGYEILYQLSSGVVLTSKEVFDSAEEGLKCYREALGL